ncbi:bile acid:sodium symporter family protein [Parabacteroides sp. Marseille-P3160]|uniref:bile acid:sodium symporter family protein n=1 Tax=Parabacteroides sp. Marseille-P3160 TaxID=1917887 RepID=UPI00350FD48C
MHKILRFIKEWMLLIAMFLGVAAYPLISYISFLTPYLIFTMLLVTFCKLSPRQILIHPAHIGLISIQLIGSLGAYFLLKGYDPLIAQGAMICMLAPTATSAPVITGMLGGNVAFLTTYILLCNMVVAFFAPLFFSFMGTHSDLSFWASFFFICKQVVPLLILPLLMAWGMRRYTPRLHRKIAEVPQVGFYLWAVALVIVMGKTMSFLVNQENPNYRSEIGLAVTALIVCAAQFIIGRSIGKRYKDPVSSGQGLGQKNTILAIWMAQTYLNPVASLAPAAYVVWQNIINSYQLWLKEHRENKQEIVEYETK